MSAPRKSGQTILKFSVIIVLALAAILDLSILSSRPPFPTRILAQNLKFPFTLVSNF
jgi:hypothetical protein